MGGGESHGYLKMNKAARNDVKTCSATSLDSLHYPYPRSHSTMMVIPSRRPYAPEDDPAINSFTTSYPNPSINYIISMSSENGNAYVRPRPPLNRSCPPIPESRSNESIMTHASSAVESAQTPTDKCVIIGNPMATQAGIPKSVSQQSIKSQKSSSLPSPSSSQPAASINNNNNNNTNGRPSGQQLHFAPRPPIKRQHVEPPRSPLMSVAHSVRNSLSKLGNRLSSNRGESPQKEPTTTSANIKNSRSMSSMNPAKNSKSKLPKLVTDQNDNLRSLHKSSSMEAPPRSNSNDSLKQIIANKRGERVTKPSSLPLPRYPPTTSSNRFPTRNLDTIISEDSEASRMESVKCEKLKKTREADEVPTPPSYDLKDLVSRFVDDSTLATADVRRGSQPYVVEPDEVTVAEEIPMDTNPTPDDVTTIGEDEEIDDVKEEVLIGDDSITVVREEHCTRRAAPPIFVAPAPPRLSPAEEQRLTVGEETLEEPRSSGESSDSTVKENCNIIYIRKVDENGVQHVETVVPNRRDSSRMKKEKEKERKEMEKLQKKEKEWLKEKEKEKEREKVEKGQRTPLSTRSIKQFLLRRPSEKRDKKTPPMSRSMVALSPARSRLALPFHHPRFAPLAELESSVVENSPAVEIAPGKWSKPSPKILRRNSECSVKDLIKEAGRQEVYLALRGDDNGNVTASPRIGTVEEQKGLIDDEILDQPMLMGDSFPTSESMDRIRLSQQLDASQIGIDLVPLDRNDNYRSRQSRSEHSQHSHYTQPSPSNPHLPNPFTAAALKKDEQEKIINEGLSEVDDLKSQLVALKHLIQHEDKFEETSITDLVRENDALRRQLMEKDSVINMLRNQLTNLKMPSSIDS
ncbi:hypothetical protein PFISCL1PPCAC_13773 [Pristionchus fissidentatus]|uniref:Uncharacterized protein n=1 Tax=Pristionchus fissidentatus TaxID=1538716 RepID=A0AAV5VVB1_9BILA|nr:hypothetical protein PFISCL1PPCAC_13773 [Pristionchus fissidentatus]